MKLVLIIVATVAIFTATTVANLEISSDGSRRLHFIGAVDGKSFFFDDDKANYKGWRAAGNYCAQAGMHLASLDTKAQYDLIDNYNDEAFLAAEWFWTSGRDSQDLNQIKWNDTNTSAANSTYIQSTPHTPYQSCLRFYKGFDRLRFLIVPCEGDVNYPLCETHIH